MSKAGLSLLAGLILSFCVFSCQTLKVQETKGLDDSSGPVGVYLAKTSTPQGVIEFTMTINENGTGRIESMMGNREISVINIEGNNFGFKTTIETQMGKMPLTFKGAVDGDNISGTIDTRMGSLPFSGLRKKVSL